MLELPKRYKSFILNCKKTLRTLARAICHDQLANVLKNFVENFIHGKVFSPGHLLSEESITRSDAEDTHFRQLDGLAMLP